MKIKIFTFDLTSGEVPEDDSRHREYGGKSTPDIKAMEKELNAFIKDKEIIDIKQSPYTYFHHNNAGLDRLKIIYTVMYKD